MRSFQRGGGLPLYDTDDIPHMSAYYEWKRIQAEERRAMTTSLCEVATTILNHPICERFMQKQESGLLDTVSKWMENEQFLNTVMPLFSKTPAEPSAPETSDRSRATSNNTIYLVAQIHENPIVDRGVGIVHVDEHHAAILCFSLCNLEPSRTTIERVWVKDANVYICHQIVNEQVYILLSNIHDTSHFEHAPVTVELGSLDTGAKHQVVFQVE